MTKIIKAEMWDRMQYLLRNFYDRMVHFKLYYSGKIDQTALGAAVEFMLDKAPILKSSFHVTPLKPYWRVERVLASDVLSFVCCEDADAACDEFLAGVIPTNSKAQIRIAVFEEEGRSVLALLVNHMCMDGGDIKYFLSALASNYNNAVRGTPEKMSLKSGARNYELVHSKFKGDDLKKARGLFKNVSKTKVKTPFLWTKSQEADTNRIVKRVINEDKLAKIKAACKGKGVTVGDIVTAAFARAAYDFCSVGKDEPLALSCAIDLRRHIAEVGNCGLANHTAWLSVCLPKMGEAFCKDLDFVSAKMNEYKQDKFVGLYSLPLLNFGYTVFPHCLAEFAVKLGYDNPLLAISNIGAMKESDFALDGLTLTGGYFAGTTKYKPYLLMSVSTLLGKMTFAVSVRGNAEDEKLLNLFFDSIEKNFNEFIGDDYE